MRVWVIAVGGHKFEQFHKILTQLVLILIISIDSLADLPSFADYTCNICQPNIAPLTSQRRIASDDEKYQGYVGVNPISETIYFAFQGAVYQENWLTAGQFNRKAFELPNLPAASRQLIANKRLGVHDGFLDSYVAFRSYILGNITDIVKKHPTFKIRGVGQSYGAVLITLTGVDLVLNNVAPASQISLTTLGSPRVGNFEFARFVDKELGFESVNRVVHSTDTIVHFPSTTIGYRHTGVEHWIDVGTKRMYICGDVPPPGTLLRFDESPSCSNSVGPLSWNMNAHSR
jgi:predicted lipase